MFKKLLSLLSVISLFGFYMPTFADCTCKTEHLDIHEKAPCNTVIIDGCHRTVNQGNVIALAFSEKFFSKQHKAGDIVYFDVPQAIYTREGTLVLPSCSKIVAEVTNVEKPKWFNKNARVSLCFRKIMLSDNSCVDIQAIPFTKDNKLKEGPWTTFGKVALSTVTLGIVGAGAGVGFAFIPTPAKIGTGLAVGIPVGCGVGLALGLITPGCHYKAKKGEVIYALLINDFSVCSCSK